MKRNIHSRNRNNGHKYDSVRFKNDAVRFLIIGDLHGQMPKIHFKDFDAIIAPGDVCSDKGIREIYMKMYKEYVKDIDNYADWWNIVGKKEAKKLVKYSVQKGRKILEFLDSIGKPVFIVPGNWDWTKPGKEHWKFMEKDFWHDQLLKGLKNVHDIDGKLRKFKGIQLLGYGKVNGPELLEFRGYGGVDDKELSKNRRAYQRLLRKFNKRFNKLDNDLPIIFLSHNVPYNTKLDTIINKKSPVNGKHYGSNLARDIIMKHQPSLSIGGHMHEHFGKDRIRKTVILNSGFGSRVNTLVEISDKKINRIIFYGGKCR
jgi:Icc-related predicted phosphoesterase